jgi:hypothetical protein
MFDANKLADTSLRKNTLYHMQAAVSEVKRLAATRPDDRNAQRAHETAMFALRLMTALLLEAP